MSRDSTSYDVFVLPGGAQSYLPFLRFMGRESALGSPFQINFPAPDELSDLDEAPSNATVPFNDTPRSCSDNDIDSRCACPDCPAVCAVLPPIQSPQERWNHRCLVGQMSCFNFALVIVYAAALIACTFFLITKTLWSRSNTTKVDEETGWTKLRNRLNFGSWSRAPSESGYDRLPMDDPLAAGDYDDSPVVLGTTASRKQRSRSGSGQHSNTSSSLVGASSLPHALDGDSDRRRRPPSGSSGINSTSSPEMSLGASRHHRLSAGASLVDRDDTSASNPFIQPRTYPLNTYLSSFFYRLGSWCARRPYLTLALGCILCGLVNLGWKRFEVEKDPVRLWVPKGSPSERAKSQFDEAFGPFYRTEQIFLSVAPTNSKSVDPNTNASSFSDLTATRWEAVDEPLLTWDVLKWWATVEATIRELRSSPNAYSLKDICFSPQSEPDPPSDPSACVVQSIMGYFGNTLSGTDENSWADMLNECATTPVGCLPTFGQPLNPKLLLGGVPERAAPGSTLQADQARAIVVTYVVRNSLDPDVVARAEEWERTLQAYLHSLAAPNGPARQRGLEVAFTTGLSLEQELSASTNTDIPIVVLSYVLM